MTADPAGGGVRALRAAILAAVTLGLAAGAHLAGGGALSLPVLLVAIGPLMVGAALLTRRRLGALALLGWLAPMEALLHGFFGATAGGIVPVGLGAGHGHGASAGWPVIDTMAVTGLVGGSGGGHTATDMVLAHALATVLTGLALSHGERVVWLLWESLRPTFVPAPAPLLAAPAPVVAALASGMPPAPPLRFTSPRGPPLTCLCPQ